MSADESGGPAPQAGGEGLLRWSLLRPRRSNAKYRGYTFEEVLEQEIEQEISRSRTVRGQESPREPGGAGRAIDRAHAAELIGLALSGGGIRSATFNLGVLQAAVEQGLLRKFDYLSTVSGGGYIGSWLSCWLRRRKDTAGVEQELSSGRTASMDAARRNEAPPIRWLRCYSNYLTPRLGLFSADTWAAISTYWRNTSLNLVLLLPMLWAALLLPRLAVMLTAGFEGGPILLAGRRFEYRHVALLGSALLILAAVCFVCYSLRYFLAAGRTGARDRPRWSDDRGVQLPLLVPLFVAAWLCFCWLWWYAASRAGESEPQRLDPRLWIGTPILYLIFWIAGSLLIAATATSGGAGTPDGADALPAEWSMARSSVWLLLTAVGGGLAAGILLDRTRLLFIRLQDPSRGPMQVWEAAVWGPVLIVAIFSVTGILQIGFMGKLFTDEIREWWSRLGGWLLIYSLGWLGLFGAAVYGPRLMASEWVKTKATLGAGWLLSSLGGVLAGRSAQTGEPGKNRWQEAIAMVAPYAFVAGLTVLLSCGAQWALQHIPFHPSHPGGDAAVGPEYAAWHIFVDQGARFPATGALLALIAILVIPALALAWCVDVNEFSMHLFYRNRLIRSYLGASNRPGREPHPFTGFDPKDDIPLATLAPSSFHENGTHAGPYLIINSTLNLVKGDELAWQERKAASFTFTPRFCGYETGELSSGGGASSNGAPPPGYRFTGVYAYPDRGISLGTAMAISGAAASPNMGYHSSKPLAFLMTLFNVRLGWWLGNPAREDTWTAPGPRFGLGYLFVELFGLTSEKSRFVFLSDGGHFENLGIYELVKRRCRLIVACDAGQDEAPAFEDLGNAIRKCRTDLGIDVEIDLAPLRRPDPESPCCARPCAVGTIHYEQVDSGARSGTLLYLKAGLTGSEPSDLLAYRARHEKFPHERTADQWFDESQFESYRWLGHHIGTRALGALKPCFRLDGLRLDTLQEGIEQAWAEQRPGAAEAEQGG